MSSPLVGRYTMAKDLRELLDRVPDSTPVIIKDHRILREPSIRIGEATHMQGVYWDEETKDEDPKCIYKVVFLE